MNTVKGGKTIPSLKHSKKILAVLYIFCSTVYSFAQQFNFQHVGESSTAQCYCVLQDSKGFIWYSSEKGLYRYDGVSYKCFNSDNGLPHNSVFQLCEDSKGRILFNTLQGNIGYIENDSVIFPPLNKKLENWLSHGSFIIFNMYVDTNKILWIATYNELYKTVKPDDYSDIEPVSTKNIDSARVFVKIIDSKKALYSLHRCKYKTYSTGVNYHMVLCNDNKTISVPYFITSKEINPSQFFTLLLNNGQLLWGYQNKLYIISPNGKVNIKYLNGFIIYISQDKKGGVWVGLRSKGVAYYSNDSLNTPPIYSLPGTSVSCITEDSENGVWVSTLEKGIFHANSTQVIDYSNNDGLNDRIGCIGIINKKLLVNDYKNSVTIINDTAIYAITPPKKSVIYSVRNYVSLNGNIYINAVPGFMYIDTLLKTWKQVKLKYNKYAYAYLNDIAKSDSNQLFGVTYSYLCTIKDSIEDTINRLPARGKFVLSTHSGELLVATSNGLYKYENGMYTRIASNLDIPFSKEQGPIEDKNGNIWIITYGKGIFIYNRNKTIKNISTKDGLASDYLHAIVFDSLGNAWVGTDEGLSKISVSNNYSIDNYDMRHGIISKEVLSLALAGTKLWLGTDNGLCVINTLTPAKNTNPPSVYLSSVWVNNTPIFHVSSFNYNHNNLKFNLQGLTFKDNVTRFKYRLIGYDSTWNNSTSTSIILTNLPSGKYRFEAKAINADGIASKQPVVFSFIINTPFWKTWWFILLEGLILFLVIFLFIRYRLNIIQKREEEKTELNKMVSEYQMTALRAQMNPHFVFNAINSIQEFVLDNDSQQAYNYLTKFAQLIRMVLNNAKEKSVSLETELETIETYIKLEQLRFSNKFDFVLDVNKDIDLYSIHVPTMVIQPYLENAIWHGLMPLGKLRKGLLKLAVIHTASELRIIIEDNGIGREQSALIKKTKDHKSVGMELTQQRLNMLANLPEYKSSSVIINDLHNKAGENMGTRVEIVITSK